MKKLKEIYYLTVIPSMLVGLWHFVVPHVFRWYDYLPMQYENLIVGIDYTDYSFSTLLFGLSLLLTVFGKRALSLNPEVIIFYSFLTIVWVVRAALSSFIEPWPLDPISAAAIGQLVATDVLAVLMAFMGVRFWLAIKQTRRH